MSFISAYVINELAKRTPEQGAAWVSALPYPQIGQIIPALCQCADAELVTKIGGLAQALPDLAGAVAWLQAHSPYLVAMVQALRAMPDKANGKEDKSGKPVHGL